MITSLFFLIIHTHRREVRKVVTMPSLWLGRPLPHPLCQAMRGSRDRMWLFKMSYQSKSESKTQGYVAATEPESCELSPVSTTALSMITPPLDPEFSIFFRSLRFGLKPDSLSRRRLSLDASFLITFCLNFCSCPRSFWRTLCWRRRQNCFSP